LFSQAAIVAVVSLGALLLIATIALAMFIIPPIIQRRKAKKAKKDDYVSIENPTAN